MSSAGETFDVAVLGGGAAGAAAADALGHRGVRAVLLERFSPAHPRGSSHGDGRIFRFTYEETAYVEMGRLASESWRRLEADTGETILERSGNWECGPRDSEVLAELEATLERSGLAYERWSPAESRRRMPHFAVPEGSVVLYQPEGGVVRAERAVRALWRDAAHHGVVTRDGTAVEAIEAAGEKIVVRGAWGEIAAGAMIIAAGGWAGGLLASLGVELPLAVTREQVVYFAPRDPGAASPDYRVGAMPTLIDYHDPAQPFYGLPQIDVPGVKIGWHRSGAVVDPARLLDDEGEADPAADAIARRLQAYVRERLPGLDPEPIHRTTCLYTNTPDYHFVLDRHPELPNVAIGAGFSGHGFKFAPVLGEILAALALGEPPPVDLELFRLSRFASPERLARRTGA